MSIRQFISLTQKSNRTTITQRRTNTLRRQFSEIPQNNIKEDLINQYPHAGNKDSESQFLDPLWAWNEMEAEEHLDWSNKLLQDLMYFDVNRIKKENPEIYEKIKNSEQPLTPEEIGGYVGQEPTTHGDWQHKGKTTDF
eukprot:TRINITY_DN10415_c0_g1_i1.p1 TRINITY_DN10415_c0_g1~~TRINITY_DN10415_c0_g1_i1.p1  ORF type:complete len:155 (+),score=28.81 TRINITY_DN10415_c0_g1_i1:49-465(+)